MEVWHHPPGTCSTTELWDGPGDTDSEGSTAPPPGEPLSCWDIECWLKGDVVSRCQELCRQYDAPPATEEQIAGLLNDVEIVFEEHVNLRESRRQTDSGVRAKQNSAQGAALKALPKLMAQRNMIMLEGRSPSGKAPPRARDAAHGSRSDLSDPAHGSPRDLSAYELSRLRMISENQQKLRVLGLL